MLSFRKKDYLVLQPLHFPAGLENIKKIYSLSGF